MDNNVPVPSIDDLTDNLNNQTHFQPQGPVEAPKLPTVQEPVIDFAEQQRQLDEKFKLETTFDVNLNVFSTADDKLTPEQLEDKNSFLTLFKGKEVNKEGNLINEEGKVVLNKEAIKAFIEKGTIPTDDKGNEVNAIGDILRTVEDINEQDTLVFPLRSKIEQEFGIALGDSKYEDTEEGLTQLVKDAISTSNTNIVKEFLESKPELYSIYKHLATGNTLDTYSTKFIDYKSINVEKLDDTGKLSYIKAMLTKQGLPNPDSMIDLIKSAGADTIKKQTADAILFLDQKQTEDKQLQDKQYEESIKLEEENTVKYWKQVEEKVTKGIIGNINIPVTERKAFQDYLSKPVDKNGNSANYLASEKDTIDFQLLTAFLRFKGADISKLANYVAKEMNVEKLRERFRKQGQGAVSNSMHDAGAKTSGKGHIVSIDELMSN